MADYNLPLLPLRNMSDRHHALTSAIAGTYLERHRLRIADYQTFQTQGITIGSGAVESTIIGLTH